MSQILGWFLEIRLRLLLLSLILILVGSFWCSLTDISLNGRFNLNTSAEKWNINFGTQIQLKERKDPLKILPWKNQQPKRRLLREAPQPYSKWL